MQPEACHRLVVRSLAVMLAVLAVFAVVAEEWADCGPAEEARLLLDRDEWREALALALKLDDEFDYHPEIRSVLGEALYRAGEFEEAGDILEKLIESGSPPPRALLTLGLIRAAEARFEEASRLVGEALARAPDDPVVLFRAAGFQETRAETVELLERYLAIGDGEDPDRIESARGTIRLFGELREKDLWVSKDRPERMEARLRPVPDGRGGVLGYTVPILLGGKRKPVRILLDTGSPGLFLSNRVARKRGFVPLAEETTFGGGGSGRHLSGRGLFDRFAFGALVFTEALATTSKRAIDPYSRYDGLLGLSVFDGYRITLDLGERRLLLEPSHGEPLGDRYWVIMGQAVIRVRSAGGPAGLFLLDTGANHTILDLSFAGEIEGATIGDLSRVHGYGGARQGARTVDGAVVGFQGLQSDGRRMNAVDLSMRSRMGGVEISGFMGLDLLDGARITIDTVTRRVLITKDP